MDDFEPDFSIRQLQHELAMANEEIADLNHRLEVACDELARNRNGRELAEDGLTQVMEIVAIYAKREPVVYRLQQDLLDELGK